MGRCGSLWIVVGRCGSLWVVPGFSNYGYHRHPDIVAVFSCSSFNLDYLLTYRKVGPYLSERSLMSFNKK